MSSHHIVRDAQEPALVIASTSITFETLGQLLEWSPVVVVLESCLKEVLTWEIKIDKIICQDIHYQTIFEASIHQQPLQIFPLEGSQTAHSLHFAIQNLIKNGHDAISIIWEEFTPNDFEKYTAEAELIVYQDNSKSYFVSKGIFKKWVTVNTTFYFPEKGSVHNAVSLAEISPTTYQATHTGMISFETSKVTFVKEI